MTASLRSRLLAEDSERSPADDPQASPANERRERGLKRWALNGAVGGAVATVVMTAYRLSVAASLPPTANFWARFVAGGEPEDHPLPGLLLHLGYGSVAGTLFGALFGSWSSHTDSQRERELSGVVLGAVYSLVLSVFGERVVLGGVLSMDLDATESLVFHVGHLVYGLSLGSWVASGSTYEDVVPLDSLDSD